MTQNNLKQETTLVLLKQFVENHPDVLRVLFLVFVLNILDILLPELHSSSASIINMLGTPLTLCGAFALFTLNKQMTPSSERFILKLVFGAILLRITAQISDSFISSEMLSETLAFSIILGTCGFFLSESGVFNTLINKNKVPYAVTFVLGLPLIIIAGRDYPSFVIGAMAIIFLFTKLNPSLFQKEAPSPQIKVINICFLIIWNAVICYGCLTYQL